MTPEDKLVAQYRRERAPFDPLGWEDLGEWAKDAWRHQYRAVMEDADGAI